jgi:hypothetical protein
VSVEQQRRLARRAQPLGVNQRVPFAFNEPRARNARGRDQAADEFSGAPDVAGMLGGGADAGDSQEFLQLLNDEFAVHIAFRVN